MPLTTRYMAAMHLARSAGELAHEFFAHRHFMFAGHSNAQDFATRSIGTIRTLIRTKLGAAFPGDAVVDASIASADFGALERIWLVDAIAGSGNFLRGIPFYAVVLAYIEQAHCELGVIFDPEHDELFHARRGDGAWCEHAGTDTRLEVAHCDTLDGALVCVAHDERQPDPGYLMIRHELMDAGSVARAMGTAALELAQVAAGRCDGFIGLHVSPQGLHSGMLLVDEAGGFTTSPARVDGARVDAPFVGCAPGIARPLTETANVWSERQAALRHSAELAPMH